jgi:hypothetical protein
MRGMAPLIDTGSPLVRVPVLSITTVSMRAAVSTAVAVLNSTPRGRPARCLRPLPHPGGSSGGVAAPRCQPGGAGIDASEPARGSAEVALQRVLAASWQRVARHAQLTEAIEA